ncbi:hypothetical protein HDV03_003152 [Kappamyces sp. JEL0829]|nr:hypothetical protein HDV03_003152 [Kappamyces sp. JEL0829]
MNYKFNVLVPINEEKELSVPIDSYLQQVHIGDHAKWRVVRNHDYNLPPYLTDHKEQETVYRVKTTEKKYWQPLELGSPFLKKWDQLALTLLLFTASVTPFETAFITNDTLTIDVLFLINRCVDIIFFYDMLVQMRTPYRDPVTGSLVLDVNLITRSYLAGWFPLDLLSVLPFEFVQYAVPGGSHTSLSTLQLLRFFRLTRLFKLLRVFRASRKLKQAQIASGLRYFSIEMVKIVISLIFLVHWLACGYRLVADQQSPSDPIGWLNTYMASKNETSISSADAYFAALYWSASTVTLIGCQVEALAPSCTREYIYAFFVQIIGFLQAVYIISSVSTMTHATSAERQSQDILVDNYLEMFDDLRLDPRLKYTVFQHLTDYFAEEANHKQAEMLKKLPKSLHSFIAQEIFLNFIVCIPFLEAFVDLQPTMIQELCLSIEKKMIPNNSFLFSEGVDGIYQIEQGIVAMDGVVYPSGSLIGLTCLREHIKVTECRALTDVKANFLPRKELLAIMEKHPKVRYYCKRWTAWQLLRDYILTYSRLYYTAARRGALMSPPLYSKRPNMEENEEDDLDVAVLDHLDELGY